MGVVPSLPLKLGTPKLKEMLAVVWGIEHFSIYLYGKAFCLLTHHKPLDSILSYPPLCIWHRAKRTLRLAASASHLGQRTSFAASVADYGSMVNDTTGPSTRVGPTARMAMSSGPSVWMTRQNIQTPSGASVLGWLGTLCLLLRPQRLCH